MEILQVFDLLDVGCWIFLLQWMNFTEEVLTSNIGPLQLVLGGSSSCGCHWCHGNVAFGQVEYDHFIMIYIYPLVRKHVPIWRFKYPLYVFHVHKDLCEYPLSAESESHWWWLTTTQKSWFDHDRNVFEDWNLGLGARNVLPSPKADNGSWVDDTMKSCCLRQLHQLGKTPDQFVFFNRAGVEI